MLTVPSLRTKILFFLHLERNFKGRKCFAQRHTQLGMQVKIFTQQFSSHTRLKTLQVYTTDNITKVVFQWKMNPNCNSISIWVFCNIGLLKIKKKNKLPVQSHLCGQIDVQADTCRLGMSQKAQVLGGLAFGDRLYQHDQEKLELDFISHSSVSFYSASAYVSVLVAADTRVSRDSSP